MGYGWTGGGLEAVQVGDPVLIKTLGYGAFETIGKVKGFRKRGSAQNVLIERPRHGGGDPVVEEFRVSGHCAADQRLGAPRARPATDEDRARLYHRDLIAALIERMPAALRQATVAELEALTLTVAEFAGRR